MPIRVIGTLKGNIDTIAADQIKYSLMFQTLGSIVDVIEIHDTSLKGKARLINAIRTFHPNRSKWRERFYKNVPAFRERSKRITQYLQTRQSDFDITFQVGVLYDTRWEDTGPPSIIYTDYTSYLSRERNQSGRSPLTESENREWFTLECKAFNHASHIFTRGKNVRQSVIKHYGIPEQKVTAVGSGLNLTTLPQVNMLEDKNKVCVLFIGKDFYRKGADIVLKAWAQIRKQNPHAHLKMVTQVPKDLDLPLDGVEFIAPTWDHTMINTLYEEADIFVLPSRLETWGDVLLEAMAYGIPCIGVSGEAMEEIIIHEQTGLIVPPQDAPELAKAISQLMNDAPLRQAWGQAGREHLEQNYMWGIIMEKILPIIEAVI